MILGRYRLRYRCFAPDTIYACQDKKDDMQAGVRSIYCAAFRRLAKPMLAFFGAILVSYLVVCGILNHAGVAYFIVTAGGGMVLLAKELWHVEMDIPESCWRTMRVRSVTSAYIYNVSDVGSSSTEMDLCLGL
jgi:4-hydroxybenzoate polyprenyltransferase